MLIRITHKSTGIVYYLETGQKKGRKATRDNLDQRVYLAGNLDAFSTALDYSTRHKRWKAHYWHITASFALENNNLDDATLAKISDDILGYYLPGHDTDSLIFAVEAHRPKIQSDQDQSTGELHQRLLHMHLAISKLDPVTDRQARMIPAHKKADQAFQSYIAKKYQLVDPADRKRLQPFTKADILARLRQEEATARSKQSQVALVRRLLSEELRSVTSIAAAIAQLKQYDYVLNVTDKRQKSGKRYLQVNTTLSQRSINLRGKGFESLEALYYDNDTKHGQSIIKPAIKAPDVTLAQLKKTFTDRQQRWLEEEAKRTPYKIKDYDAVERRYAKRFEPIINEEAQYLVLYKNRIGFETLKGYRIWEKNNKHYLFNHELGVKIYDKPNMIVAQIPNDPAIRKQVVTLMLKMAMAKGWDINSLIVTGSKDFKQEVAQQVEALQTQQLSQDFIDCVRPAELRPPPLPSRPRINQIDQLMKAQQQSQTATLSKEDIAQLKQELQAQQVIAYAVEHLGLIEQYYKVTADNKIADERLQSKPRNGVDFLVKTCNLPLSEALVILSELLTQQAALDNDSDDDFRPH